MRTRTHRKDENHGPMTEELEKHGWLVLDTHNTDNFVDAIAIKDGHVVFVEFKNADPETYSKGDKRRNPQPHQLDLHAKLRAKGAQVAVVQTREDLGQFVKAIGAQ